VLLSAIASWPLIGNLASLTRLPDPTLDDCIYYWNDWWVWSALQRRQNPLFCTEVFHPDGTSLVLSPLALPLALFSIPFQLGLGPLHGAAVATKLCMFLSFPVGILGMARLLRRSFGLEPWPAFLAGCLFAFVPFRMLHLGRVHYLMGALVPWFLERLATGIREGPWRSWLGGGVIFAFAGACDASLLPEMALAGAAVCAYEGRRAGGPTPRGLLVRAAAVFACGGLLLAPLLVPMLLELRANPGVDVVSQLHFQEEPDPIQLAFSPDVNNLGWYLAPAFHEGLFPPGSGLAEGAREKRFVWRAMHAGQEAGGVSILASGVFLVVGVLFVVAGLRRELWPFAALAVLGLLLALGPFRSIGGEVVRMPHYWLAKFVPGLAAGRYVAANLRLFYLGASVLAGFGMLRLSRRLGPPWIAPALLAAAGILACLGWLQRPFVYDPLEHEPVYRAIAEDPAPGAVVELPHDFRPNLRRMALGQILHRRAICGGPVTRVRPEVVEAYTEDFLVVPRLLEPPAPRPPDDPGLLAEAAENERLLRNWGVRFVLLRRRLFGDPLHRERTLAYLAAHPSLEVEEIDGHLLVRIAGG